MSTDRQKCHLEEDGVRRQSEIVSNFPPTQEKGNREFFMDYEVYFLHLQSSDCYTILALEVAQGGKRSHI